MNEGTPKTNLNKYQQQIVGKSVRLAKNKSVTEATKEAHRMHRYRCYYTTITTSYAYRFKVVFSFSFYFVFFSFFFNFLVIFHPSIFIQTMHCLFVFVQFESEFSAMKFLYFVYLETPSATKAPSSSSSSIDRN